jgi:excisionase family DNA binding protein
MTTQPTHGLTVLLVRPEDAALLLGLGRTKVYQLMRSGALRSVKIGGLRRIPATALAEFVAELEARERVA